MILRECFTTYVFQERNNVLKKKTTKYHQLYPTHPLQLSLHFHSVNANCFPIHFHLILFQIFTIVTIQSTHLPIYYLYLFDFIPIISISYSLPFNPRNTFFHSFKSTYDSHIHS
jgi:hypothetical protein